MNKFINEKGANFYKAKDSLVNKNDLYQNLYFKHTNIDETPLREVLGENVNRLLEEKPASLKRDISYTEIAHAFTNIKINKSPCLDGFTVEFNSFFCWGGGGGWGLYRGIYFTSN